MFNAVRDVTDKKKEPVVVKGSYEGLPYIGPPINLKDTDKVENVLKLNQVLKVRCFDLSKEEDLKEYEAVCQKIQDGEAQLSFEDRRYNKEDKIWVTLMRWIYWWYSPITEKV
jgi:hypothetical protein